MPDAAACLVVAFEQLSKQGQAILRQDEQTASEAPTTEEMTKISARAARRNELHHATLAGKGGLLLDFSDVTTDESKEGVSPAAKTSSAANSPKTAEKPASEWTLADCRSWLIDASQRIAQHWVNERKKATGSAAQKYPSGNVEELEGRLVEQSISLCEHLEAALKARNEKSQRLSAGANRTKTPRVENMSKLGIKWQHSHERGSGGKGGVGGSGTRTAGAKAIPGRLSAGQTLTLWNAKKLGALLKDPLAGEAFHKELQRVQGQQQTRKRKLLLEESSRQRMQQMKRKPWLQARIQT